jgi:GTP cyclohydrolase IA
MNRDHLRSNGHSNGHSAQVERKPKRVDYPRLLALGRELLLAIGEDPDREGLRETPRRWADAWREFIEYDPGTTDTCFESVSTDQMVVVSGMRVWSICQHHLLPIWADISIGYIATDRILGLSKFARITQKYAHQLQLQERLCKEIADEIVMLAKSTDVAILAQGQHLCMTARGIKTPAIMTSTIMRGVFREKHEARMEFLRLTERSHI